MGVRQVPSLIGRVERDDRNLWNRGLRECLGKMGMDSDSLRAMSKEQIKDRVIEIDTGEWRRNMATKNTLYIYRRYKVGVKEEDIYRNDGPSVFLYRARANALGLNDFNRHRGGGDMRETLCGLCGEEVEDLGHFMLSECFLLILFLMSKKKTAANPYI